MLRVLQRSGPKVREEELIGEIDEIPKYRVFKRTCTCMQTVKSEWRTRRPRMMVPLADWKSDSSPLNFVDECKWRKHVVF